MKKLKKNRNKLVINEDELFLLNNPKKSKKIKKNKNKCIGYSLIWIIYILIIIIILILFIIIKLINSALKSKNNENITTEFNNLMIHYNSNTTILLIGMGKLENNYIREWIEYHKGIGISKIILYDNNPIDGENLSEPIKDYVDSNFVEIDESFRGKSYLQIEYYTKHFDNNYMKYDWITFNDIDEFIFLERKWLYKYSTIFRQPNFNDTDNIILTWKYYDDNDILDVINGNYSVLNRFTRNNSFGNNIIDSNCLSKAIYKGKVERNYLIGIHCIQGFEDLMVENMFSERKMVILWNLI